MTNPRPWGVLGTVLVLAAAIAAGLAWALASPLGGSPDDDFHQASIWCPSPVEESGCTVHRDSAGQVETVEVPRVVAQSAACVAFHSELSASCTTHIGTKPFATDRFNRGEYPGPYYRVMHLFVGPDAERSVAVMRIVNVLLSVALFGALALTATTRQRQVIGLALLAPLVPLGIYMTASINPTGWAFVGVSVAALGLLISADAPSTRRVVIAGVLACIGAAMAVSARGDAGPFVCVAVAAVALATVRRDARWFLTRAPAFVGVGLIGLISYWSSRQATLLNDVGQVPVDKATHLFYRNVTELPNLFRGIFGSWALGWLDVHMPETVSASSLFVAIAVIVIGFTALTVRKVLSVGLVALVLVAVPLLLLQRLGVGVGFWVQPRYLLPLAPVFLALMAYDVRRRGSVPVPLTQGMLVVALASMANALALYTTLRRYLTGLDGPVILGRDVQWWWSAAPSPRVVFVIGALGFTIVAVALILGDRLPPWNRRPALDDSREDAAADETAAETGEAPVRP